MTTTTQTKPAAVNDITASVDGFKRNLGNGKLAAEHFAAIVHSVVKSRDNTIISRLFDTVITVKRDAAAGRAMKAILASVYPGAQLKKHPKTGKFQLRTSKIEADVDALSRMDEAVAKGLSLRDTFVKHVQGEKAKTEKAFDPKAWAERVAKAHPKELDVMIAALQAQRKAVK